VAKRTLYQTLQVSPAAEPEVIKAAYEARFAALKESVAPEVAAERTILREAYELLCDPVRRKLYDTKLKEERLRALSSGGEEEPRPRPANARSSLAAEPSAHSHVSWMAGISLLVAVGVGGTWVWLDHKRKVEAQRLEAERQAEDARLKEERARLQRETVDWIKDRTDATMEAQEQRRQEIMRQNDNRRLEYDRQRAAQQEQMEEQRRRQAEQRATYEEQRREQENLRRSQQQLERDRRYLQELERNRGMTMPSR
jgi:curved DNA-binding protein CbpA